MDEKDFVIPMQDEELYVAAEGKFSVDKVDEVDQLKVEENINGYISNIDEWYKILEYFPSLFAIIVHPDLISKEIMLRSVQALTNGFSRLSDTLATTLPNFLDEEKRDNSVIDSMTRIRSSLPPYLYLLSRLDAILEAKAVKLANLDKKDENAKDNFYEDVVYVRKQIIGLLETLVTRKESSISALEILFKPCSLPEGIPR